MVNGNDILIGIMIITIIFMSTFTVYSFIKDVFMDSIESAIVGTIALCIAWLGIFGLQFVKSQKDITYYNTCVENGYTVSVNGYILEHPEKVNIKGYDISFDDEKKEVILSD